MHSFLREKTWLVLIAICCWCCPASITAAENGDDIFEQASALIKQEKFAEALPLLKKAVEAQPNNAIAHYFLGFSLVVAAADIPDEAGRKDARVRARNSWIRAKELGIKQPNVDALIASIPPDGSPSLEQIPFSRNAQANKLMEEAEGFYTTGKLDEALAKYQQALKLDPQIYEAALFSGDVYLHRKDYQNAETWYQKAIAIDPDRETAYRYSATPLMKQGKTDLARDRYIEAYITEPYNRFTVAGLQGWAQVTKTELHDLEISIPAEVVYDDAGNPTINLDPQAMVGGKSDGSFAWAAYELERLQWHKNKFFATFPDEEIYRHSLPEEAAALRAVLKVAEEEKIVGQLEPNLAKLKKLTDDGLLESFILLSLTNEGIAQDHAPYLQKHRALLRKFVVDYVIGGE